MIQRSDGNEFNDIFEVLYVFLCFVKWLKPVRILFCIPLFVERQRGATRYDDYPFDPS